MSGPHTPVNATAPVSDDVKARLESLTLEEFPSTPTSLSSNGHAQSHPLHAFQSPTHHAFSSATTTTTTTSSQNGSAQSSSSSSSGFYGTAATLVTTSSSGAEIEENVITSSSSVMVTTSGAPVDPSELDEGAQAAAAASASGRFNSSGSIKAHSASSMHAPVSAEHPHHHHHAQHQQQPPSSSASSNSPSDIIPTAIVIKNIPFAMKRDQLIALLDELHVPQPYALNYHFENGAFRGLAFANFRNSQEADMVVTRLDGHEYMGRKIKVEYKKVLPPEEAARKEAERRASIAALNDRVMEFDLNDPATRQLYDKMVAFRDDKLRNELIFAKSITGPERKLVRAIGQKLGFFYRTEDNGEERFFKVTRRPSVSVNKVNLKEMELDRMPRKYSLTNQQSRPDLSQFLGGGGSGGGPSSLSGSVAGPAAERLMTRTTRSLSLSARDQPPFARSAVFRKNSFVSQTPPPGFNALRQPKGPDAGSNFQNTVGRKPSLNPSGAAMLPFDPAQVEAALTRKRESHPLDIVDPATRTSVHPGAAPNLAGDVAAANRV
ncbi:hypothetical protein SYNPS1DRAFT_25416 [Syncephalis pseudoplumigaleata]|uniref:RRM domain-containing protein n=1 Tax=Syncephalis pseudoplumigaleata TaxID=1712513 RepID=A0A4P9YSR7_9FUNG|nr:hypothetical protein SYNPS1DRAFT_25416 [Syncephalis pseudoplumigaleata]|eukprot:RKP22728.1 hypothetical protein SYNPS1DRAFT_25416 [Syncephalis pseudoplumigaleata]